MKAILISIRPQWVEKIASGEKTIEVRKTAPKCEVPFKAYIYCTKGKDEYEWLYRVDNNGYDKAQSWHGKVIGEFVCNELIQYNYDRYFQEYFVAGYIGAYMPLQEMCLTQKGLFDYGRGKTLYGWHISDLKIYDKPKELSEFYRICKNPCKPSNGGILCVTTKSLKMNGCDGKIPLTRPPQSYMFVEEVEQ